MKLINLLFSNDPPLPPRQHSGVLTKNEVEIIRMKMVSLRPRKSMKEYFLIAVKFRSTSNPENAIVEKTMKTQVTISPNPSPK